MWLTGDPQLALDLLGETFLPRSSRAGAVALGRIASRRRGCFGSRSTRSTLISVDAPATDARPSGSRHSCALTEPQPAAITQDLAWLNHPVSKPGNRRRRPGWGHDLRGDRPGHDRQRHARVQGRGRIPRPLGHVPVRQQRGRVQDPATHLPPGVPVEVRPARNQRQGPDRAVISCHHPRGARARRRVRPDRRGVHDAGDRGDGHGPPGRPRRRLPADRGAGDVRDCRRAERDGALGVAGVGRGHGRAGAGGTPDWGAGCLTKFRWVWRPTLLDGHPRPGASPRSRHLRQCRTSFSATIVSPRSAPVPA